MSSQPSLNAIHDLLTRGVHDVIVRAHLERDLKKGATLRIKLGMDPTAPDLHLGHAVVLRKLRAFQELGHQIVFIIGDATARIGDPSGKSKSRPPLSSAQIESNAQTYFEQVGQILNIKKVEIHRNSEWLDKFTIADFIKLAASFTVSRMIERDDFSKRLKSGAELGVHELLYPTMQAYDSVAIRASVELGGTDQTFNVLAGRDLQRKMGMSEQDVITCPLLIGLDGKEKMSKSLGNYIGISEDAHQMFGKVMTIPDGLMVHYFELATEVSEQEIQKIKKSLAAGENPRNMKALLAREVVALYHGAKAAREAEAAFDRVFKQKGKPAIIPVIKISYSHVLKNTSIPMVDLLVATKLVASKSEARRVIFEGGVKVDGKVIHDPVAMIALDKKGVLVQKGKRHFVRLRR